MVGLGDTDTFGSVDSLGCVLSSALLCFVLQNNLFYFFNFTCTHTRRQANWPLSLLLVGLAMSSLKDTHAYQTVIGSYSRSRTMSKK